MTDLAALREKLARLRESTKHDVPKRKRAIGLTEDDCAIMDRTFNLPHGYGWKRLQAIRTMTPEDFDYEAQVSNDKQ